MISLDCNLIAHSDVSYVFGVMEFNIMAFPFSSSCFHIPGG